MRPSSNNRRSLAAQKNGILMLKNSSGRLSQVHVAIKCRFAAVNLTISDKEQTAKQLEINMTFGETKVENVFSHGKSGTLYGIKLVGYELIFCSRGIEYFVQDDKGIIFFSEAVDDWKRWKLTLLFALAPKDLETDEADMSGRATESATDLFDRDKTNNGRADSEGHIPPPRLRSTLSAPQNDSSLSSSDIIAMGACTVTFADLGPASNTINKASSSRNVLSPKPTPEDTNQKFFLSHPQLASTTTSVTSVMNRIGSKSSTANGPGTTAAAVVGSKGSAASSQEPLIQPPVTSSSPLMGKKGILGSLRTVVSSYRDRTTAPSATSIEEAYEKSTRVSRSSADESFNHNDHTALEASMTIDSNAPPVDLRRYDAYNKSYVEQMSSQQPFAYAVNDEATRKQMTGGSAAVAFAPVIDLMEFVVGGGGQSTSATVNSYYNPSIINNVVSDNDSSSSNQTQQQAATIDLTEFVVARTASSHHHDTGVVEDVIENTSPRSSRSGVRLSIHSLSSGSDVGSSPTEQDSFSSTISTTVSATNSPRGSKEMDLKLDELKIPTALSSLNQASASGAKRGNAPTLPPRTARRSSQAVDGSILPVSPRESSSGLGSNNRRAVSPPRQFVPVIMPEAIPEVTPTRTTESDGANLKQATQSKNNGSRLSPNRRKISPVNVTRSHGRTENLAEDEDDPDAIPVTSEDMLLWIGEDALRLDDDIIAQSMMTHSVLDDDDDD